MVQDGTIALEYKVRPTGLHQMDGNAGGHDFMATGGDYKTCLGNAMQYIRLLGGDPLNIYVNEVAYEGEVVETPKVSLGELQHKLDTAYDLVDEVVADMRKMGWEGLAERTHRLYEGLYVDAIQTIEEEGLVRESAR